MLHFTTKYNTDAAVAVLPHHGEAHVLLCVLEREGRVELSVEDELALREEQEGSGGEGRREKGRRHRKDGDDQQIKNTSKQDKGEGRRRQS